MKNKKHKVVYNACFGGFGLSEKAAKRLVELGMIEMEKEMKEVASWTLPGLDENNKAVGFNAVCYSLPMGIERHDSRLVQVVEELGKEASGTFGALRIKKISGNKYLIDDYDGNEQVQTPEKMGWTLIKEEK
ncbi:MAG TPA: hypothetical protein VMX17_09110 [Candidatus Glassbacteria bacterium]|nr:hypothetical protein [Candidatus Glassbacteria bacterium]